MFAAIHNDCKVIAANIGADIGNAYLHAKTNEKLYTVLVDEYSELSGKTFVLDKGLYGLRSSGAKFPEHQFDINILRKIAYHPRQTKTRTNCLDYVSILN